jgi:hypothetical protein
VRETQLDTVRIAYLTPQRNTGSENPGRSEVFVRQIVAASSLVAEKKIDYLLLDNAVGWPPR